MRRFFQSALAGVAMGGLAFVVAPSANAAGLGVEIGPHGGIGFSVSTGGYCDRWGCPGDYWNYPVYYGPVFYDGAWYRGPMYYRMMNGRRYYWVHGGWHYDHWRGPRPDWARNDRYGPALGLDYYRGHGFRVRDRDWNHWHARHHGDHDRHDWHGRDHGDHGRDHGGYDHDDGYHGH